MDIEFELNSEGHKNEMARAISIKITPAFFTELEQTILKLVWNQKKKNPNSQSNAEKEKKGGGITIMTSSSITKL